MRLNKYISALSAATILTVASTSVLAHQQGDFIVRAGATNVNPDSEQATIFATDQNMTVHLAAGTPAITASVEDDTQLGLNLVYFYSDQIAIELLAATPFKHDINVHVGDATLNLGETKQLPPTLSVLYYFNEPGAKWQPYAGLGINYTVFFEEKFNPALTSTADGAPQIVELNGEAFGPVPLAVNDLKLKNSWGLSAQVGVDYQLDDKWLVNASMRYIDIDTTGRFTAVGGAVPGKVDVDVDPWVYTLSVGYKF